MIEISNDIPFLWRLRPESSGGYCSVALVVPHTSESDIQDLTIETGILSLSSGNSSSETEEVLEWNQDDISLFLALINQRHLLTLRNKHGIQNLKPGITGLAQINGRDDLSDEAKVSCDLEYLNSRGIVADMVILLRTIPKVVSRTGVKH